ncbi:MAG: YcnI family protein [Sphingomonadales bacterium]|jgi:uncharacterized protein YcnI
MRIMIAVLLAAATPAAGHITAVPASGAAGSYLGFAVRVGHGCGGAATTSVRVELPAGIASVRPQPKPGWTLQIERAALSAPVMVEGKPVSDRVAAIIWSGNLPADQFDDFGLLIRMPDAGMIRLPVEQRCGTTVQRWDDSDDRHPAAMLEVTPAMMTHNH